MTVNTAFFVSPPSLDSLPVHSVLSIIFYCNVRLVAKACFALSVHADSDNFLYRQIKIRPQLREAMYALA